MRRVAQVSSHFTATRIAAPIVATPVRALSAAAKPLKILGISGGLRAGSFNTLALKAAQKLVPEGVSLEIFDIKDLPVYNQDAEVKLHPTVVALKAQVKAADAILFSTPEHNYAPSAAIKNAIDHVSRPWGDNTWAGKPAGIITSSISLLGGARAQYPLRQTLQALSLQTLTQPEVAISVANKKFDATTGALIDPVTTDILKGFLAALANHTRQIQAGAAVCAEEKAKK